MDGHPAHGKLHWDGPPKQVWIVWTAGWVEPGDKWMMVLCNNGQT